MQERKQNILTSVLPFGSETAGSNRLQVPTEPGKAYRKDSSFLSAYC